MKTKPAFETHTHSLTGNAALDLYPKNDVNALAVKLIKGYNPDRFQATALRFYIQNDNPTVTIFAVDKLRQDQNNYPKDKLPVKKFKIKISFEEFLQHIKRFDFTISDEAYDIKDMLVMNK